MAFAAVIGSLNCGVTPAPVLADVRDVRGVGDVEVK